MKTIKRLLVTGIVAMFPVVYSNANNVQISAVTFSQAAGTVTFSIKWDNSWNNGTNRDAIWTFVKFQDCSAGGPFSHGLLSTIYADHAFSTLAGIKSDGTGTGIDASPNNTGVMISNATTGSGNIPLTTITLKLTNLPASGTLDVRVFGVEMVFIPGGSYYCGDGSATAKSPGTITTTQCTNADSPIISSEAGVTVYVNNCIGWTGAACTDIESSSCCGVAIILAAGFQKGYKEFWIMKYEISQGQYADFLNSVPSAVNRHPGFGANRHTVINPGGFPLTYSATKPDRACNYLGWTDVSCYLDWAALRPLTEMEYEKACRGNNAPVTYETAWGSTTFTVAATISGAETGAETITTANANVCAGTTTFTGGDAGTGPLRVGIFATSTTTTKLQTGGSSWGVMELTGNVAEYYVRIGCGITGQLCAGAGGLAWGDGIVAADGTHNVTTWPNAVGPAASHIIRRGGAWNTTATLGNVTTYYLEVSNRCMGSAATRDSFIGGRGGR